MYEMEITRCFLAVFIVFFLQHHAESHDRKFNPLDESNVGPAYNIVQIRNEDVTGSLEGGHLANETEKKNIVKESENGDKSEAISYIEGNNIYRKSWTDTMKNASFNHGISKRRAPPPHLSGAGDFSIEEEKGSPEDISIDDEEEDEPSSEDNWPKRRRYDVEGKCKIPRDFSHGELKCKITKRKVICKQRCAHGYYLEIKNEAKRIKERTQKCYKKKGVWFPDRKFNDCVPDGNCQIKLRYGHSKCTYNYLNKRPRCKISCGEGKKAKWYMCNKDGKWRPRLPKCAKPIRISHPGHHGKEHRGKEHRGKGHHDKNNYLEHHKERYLEPNYIGKVYKGMYGKDKYHAEYYKNRESGESRAGKAFVMKELQGPE